MTRPSLLFCTLALSAFAQQTPAVHLDSTLPAGTPLRVALESKVSTRHLGDPIKGALIDPIYLVDRLVLPAGAQVEGRIAWIGGVPLARRLHALLSGNFTPPREVRAEFHTLILNGGTRLALQTTSVGGAANTARVSAPGKNPSTPTSPAGSAAALAFQPPSKLSLLKSALIGMLPYHRQSWSRGTLFSPTLSRPVTAPLLTAAQSESFALAADSTGGQQVHARLLHPVNSRTARIGGKVEAVVTRPWYPAGQAPPIPEGTLLHGDIVDAQPARALHRNGRVFFVFRQLQRPGAPAESIQGYLEGAEAPSQAHMAINNEGAVRVDSPKSRFLFPALAVAVAGLSLHQDIDAEGIPDQDLAGRAESGAVGLGLIGTVLAQTSRTVASGIAFTGAGFSVYTTFLARGEDVFLPANTPVRISLKSR
ncbi:hypothetical protein [Paludibaculum fermentans]|uniref:Uncharacterized protein n=1 Tax=Paludibaculum fermentans TaxID=1473598 RepID=A0A7S7NXE7_PALFE|nr:hypothetical protein [Paludibaculum fermentans]QOY91511.1 hypothetical protein IRI77_16655 [Paludibaculum fermentans]